MQFRIPVALALGLAIAAVPASADETTDQALAALRAVGREGKGNDDAGPAWKTLVSKGADALFPALGAIDDANPTAANWLRTAVDAIAEAEKNAGRKLPADKLEAFAKDTKYAAAARRIAFELLAAQDSDAKPRLLPGFLNDKSPDLRRDAIAYQLDILEKVARPSIKADLEALFPFARDKDQVDLLVKKIEASGGKASVSEHFGFVTAAHLIGPFDAPESKGFDLTYPPEKATAATSTFKGKGGAELTWKPATTGNRYGTFNLNNLVGKHKDAVAFALVVIVAEKDTPCEVRVTSPTSVKIFLNQKEIFGRDEYHHGAAFDVHSGKGTLKKGENVLVLKVCQDNEPYDWSQDWKFQMRVCDETGGPLPLKQKFERDGKPALVKVGELLEPEVQEKEEKK